MAAKKTQVKLYKIDTGIFHGMQISAIPDEIIKRANVGVTAVKKKFTEQDVNEDLIILDGFSIKIFHALKDGNPGWVSAWTDMLAEDSKMLREKNSMSSFIAFYTHGDILYALTGGQGNFSINSYVENFFGLDVLDHLIDSTTYRGLGEASKSGMTGIVKTEQRTFSGLTDALSQDSFETFFRNLKSKIDPNVVREYFDTFYPNEDYDSFFQGGNYFLLRKSIKVSDVFELILAVERVFDERESSGHNKLIPIGTIGSKIDHVKILNNALRDDLFANQDNPEVLDNYYFVPKAIKSHEIDGAEFGVGERSNAISEEDTYPEMPLVSQYIEVLLNVGRRRSIFRRVNDFSDAMRSYKIFWKHEDEEKFTAFDAVDSINGVMESGRKSYLRFEGTWYEMRQNFKDIINREFTALVTDDSRVINTPDHLNQWENGDEDSYNLDYLDNDNVMVAHRVIKQTAAESQMVQYIEYSDLIHLDEILPKLMHVKKTCNGEMRVAGAQLHMCAQKLNEGNKEEFFREYYRLIMTRAHTSSQDTKITEDDFVQLGMSDGLQLSLVISDDRVVNDANGISLCGKFYFVKMFKDMEALKFGNRFCVYNV